MHYKLVVQLLKLYYLNKETYWLLSNHFHFLAAAAAAAALARASSHSFLAEAKSLE
jgi:hypothetical protein